MTKRQSLAAFAPRIPPADAAKVTEAPPPPATAEPSKAKRPNITVYLREDTVRTLKLLKLDTNRDISDMAEEAIEEWLSRKGLLRAKTPNA